MPYVERVTKAGNTIEIERYFTSRYKKKGISRGDKVKPTKEEQEKVNTRQAERKLRIQEQQETIEKQSRLIADLIATLESWEQTAGYDGAELKERAENLQLRERQDL